MESSLNPPQLSTTSLNDAPRNTAYVVIRSDYLPHHAPYVSVGGEKASARCKYESRISMPRMMDGPTYFSLETLKMGPSLPFLFDGCTVSVDVVSAWLLICRSWV
jgi:hypothetical protein